MEKPVDFQCTSGARAQNLKWDAKESPTTSTHFQPLDILAIGIQKAWIVPGAHLRGFSAKTASKLKDVVVTATKLLQ